MIRLNSCPRCHGAVLEYHRRRPTARCASTAVGAGKRSHQTYRSRSRPTWERRSSRAGTPPPALGRGNRPNAGGPGSRGAGRERDGSTTPRRWTTGTAPPGATTRRPISLRLVGRAVTKGRDRAEKCQIPPVRYQTTRTWNPSSMSTKLAAMYRGRTWAGSAARYFRVCRRSGWSHP